MLPPLRPYQRRILDAVLDSIDHRRGLTLTVEIARQGGKNELSAHLETALLIEHLASGGDRFRIRVPVELHWQAH